MNKKFALNILKLIWFITIFSCVDKVEFDIPEAKLQISMEGMISDQKGPYVVKISRGINLNADSVVRVPIKGAIVTLFDDTSGRQELFYELSPGDYSTGGLIVGEVGHSYHIRAELSDGRVFESQPDLLNPVGAIDEIKFQYEARTVEEPYGIIDANVFKIFLDSKSIPGDNSFVRWRFTGTYKVLSYPERHWIWALGFVLHDPYPCSGLFYTGRSRAPEQLFECMCCVCYAHDYESMPQLSDGQFVSNNQFKNVMVGTVQITPATFYEKYMVTVEQMSLSKTAYEYFRLIRSQKESSSSLFIPPSGEIKGNIKGVGNSDMVLGMFWATSIASKSIFIRRGDVPYLIPAIAEIRYPCQWYPNAVTKKPDNWE